MKNTVIVLLLFSLILAGCCNTTSGKSHINETDPTNPFPAISQVATEPSDQAETPPMTLPEEETLVAAEKDDTIAEQETQSEENTAIEPTFPSPTEPATTEPKRAEKPQHTDSTTDTQPVPIETSPTEPDSIPTEPAPTQPPISPTEPETTSTEPVHTEPTGCNHEWICIQHGEEGHWRAGIVCDCGWTTYGNADELVSIWNSHSASFSQEESLFVHGGYGCVDEWIVDQASYDEWVCRYCGELKP